MGSEGAETDDFGAAGSSISSPSLKAKPAPFEYPPLSVESSTRLLKILSGDQDDPVQVELLQVSLSDDASPAFKALSYTWGGTEKPNQIFYGSSFISVTENLLAALLYLRVNSRPSDLFWIDAICINQGDLDERSSQVRLMSRIYYKAKQVIVWLYDPSLPHASDRSRWIIAQQLVPALGQSTALEPLSLPMEWLRMFEHPWFMRVWILQEVVFGKDIKVLTGKINLPWGEVLELATSYINRDTKDPQNTPVSGDAELSMAMMTVMDEWRAAQNLPIADLVHRSKFCDATEPKDKIFALLSLASDVDIDTFKPDYRLTWPQICIKLARHAISQSNTLDVLRSVGLASKSHDLPSWVPEFSRLAQSIPLTPFSATSSKLEDSPDVTSYCSESRMVAKCLLLHDIVLTGTPWLDEHNPHDPSLLSLFPLLDQWYDGVRNHPQYANDPHKRVNTFWGTLRMTLGSEASEKYVARTYSAGEGWHWHFRKLLDLDVGDSQPEDFYDFDAEPPIDDETIFDLDKNPHLLTPWAKEVMLKPVASHLHGRTFGFMDDGKMALLPRDTKEGDHLCLLYGCRIPFVVRSCGGGYHELVGAAYLHHRINWEVFEKKESWEQLQWIMFR
jgi:Heterokaryon incompatibility protein (HET)